MAGIFGLPGNRLSDEKRNLEIRPGYSAAF